MRNYALLRNQSPQRGSGDLLRRIDAAAKMAIEQMPACCDRTGIVYFVDGTDLIKIGIAEFGGLANRLRGLQASGPVPLRLLAIGRGNRTLEQLFHSRFAASRRHGEWFGKTAVARWLAEQSQERCICCSLLDAGWAATGQQVIPPG